MKFLVTLTALTLMSGTASAYVTCEKTAEAAAKAIAKINDSHARTVIDSEESEDGATVEATLDNMREGGGQSVTYTVSLTGSDPCQISKVEITGEE